MRRSPRTVRLLLAGLLSAAGLSVAVPPAHAAGEQVTAWLTTTDDSAGRHVVRGLQAQTPFAFQPGAGGGGENITVDENTRYQTFTGGGASFTDTAAWLMNSSGALSPATRDAAMRKLFSPTDGIGLSFLRNPMGASDLARYGYTYDDVPAGQTDPSLARFSVAHDLADVVPLTRQALRLNPSPDRDGLAVDGAGLDEGQRLAQRRLAEGRVLRGVRLLLREVPPGLPGAGRGRPLRHRPERAPPAAPATPR